MNKPRAPTARAFALAALAAVGCSLPLSGEEIIVRHLVDASLPSPADDSDSPDDSNDVASNDSSSGFDGYSPPTMAQIECGRLLQRVLRWRGPLLSGNGHPHVRCAGRRVRVPRLSAKLLPIGAHRRGRFL